MSKCTQLLPVRTLGPPHAVSLLPPLFFHYFPYQRKKYAYEIIFLSVFPPVCVSPLSTLEPITNLREIQQGGRAIEGDLEVVILIPYLQPFQNGGRSNF
jgi:hypothetical protein